ncbi:CPBP family intramembrane metalloprotease [Candidatus Kuenenbacteria bacterium]|nr:CPBP family intramembrane metalloprotease [Candidatus Kuenenbacteria bacterium]
MALKFNFIPRNYYLLVLATILTIVVILECRGGLFYKKFNIRTDNFFSVAGPYIIFTIAAGTILIFFAQIINNKTVELNYWLWFWGWSLPIGAVQEFLYRGYLMVQLEKICQSPLKIILINASLFALMHIIYQPLIVVLPITFLGGVGFAWLYRKFPNLILVSMSHGFLNFMALWLGFF